MRWFAFLPVLLCTACSQWDASLPEPWQRDEPKGSAVIQFDAQGISRVARMDAEVLILSRRDYRVRPDDPLSRISTIDLAVAWGQAGKQDVRSQFSIRQPWRSYSWTYVGDISSREEPQIVADFRVSTANWHVAPATKAVELELDDLDEGDAVSLSGYLIDVRRDDGSIMRTSRVRNDQGDGACEIFLVESIRRLS